MTASERARVLSAWAGVWSPIVSAETRAACWEALGLPGRLADVEPRYWATFHTAVPVPPVPLLLHAALGMPGAGAREDWLRAIGFLDLRWRDRPLPPDHLAVACEVVAAAVENGDLVLVSELRARYLSPWCRIAGERLAGDGSPLAALPGCFAADVAASAAA